MDCVALQSWFLTCLFILFLSATVIMVVLMFTTRRKNFYLDCCNGRPGLFSPVDLLHRGPHRLIYAVIFGVMSDQFLFLALLGADGGICFSTNPYQQAFCKIVNNVILVLLLCLVYGPLFACVNTSRPLLGHITGLLYLLLLTTCQILGQVYINGECYAVVNSKGEISIVTLSSLPLYVFYVILALWFVYEIVNDVIIMRRGSSTHIKNAYLFKYTQCLLTKKKQLPTTNSRWQKLVSFFWIYERDFRFPLRFLAPFVVMVSINFQLFCFGLKIAYQLSPLTDVFIEWVTHIPNGTIALGILSGLIASGTCGVSLLQFAATVHKHLKLAAQGKFKFYRKTLPSHARILACALKYGGYQIGYFVWAWLILWVMVLTLLLLIASVITTFAYYPQTVGPYFLECGLNLLWIPIVVFAHILVCKFVFLESDTGGRFLAITNRNGFNLFSYFVFLYNGIVGFVRAIIRLFLGLLFGTLLLFRLDQNIMMDGFKFADRGHKIYLGFLYLEHTYNNPVANAFVALLTDGSREETTKDNYSMKSSVRNRRARNRWLVTYTLINNPSLVPLRASQLEAERERGDQGAASPDREKAMNDYETVVLVPEFF